MAGVMADCYLRLLARTILIIYKKNKMDSQFCYLGTNTLLNGAPNATKGIVLSLLVAMISTNSIFRVMADVT